MKGEFTGKKCDHYRVSDCCDCPLVNIEIDSSQLLIYTCNITERVERESTCPLNDSIIIVCKVSKDQK